jgi:hypothetical protein
MKEKYLYLLYTLVIILALFTAGCVAPPKENSTFNPLASGSLNQNKSTPTQPTYVSEITIEDTITSNQTPVGYTTFLEQTKIPQDITCRIYEKSLYGYNGTAFVFDLKNPPMYINYTVVPKNVTVTKVYTENIKDKKETRTWIYSDYSPQSWFEVTVRSNTTKEIILQDGFGKAKGYSTYLTHTMKILDRDDLLVEFRGNEIKASASVWVKPIGNFDEARQSEFTVCAYWDEHRDTIPTAVPTTIKDIILTWTPENKVTKQK